MEFFFQRVSLIFGGSLHWNDLKWLIKNKDLCVHVQNCWIWISGAVSSRNFLGTLKFACFAGIISLSFIVTLRCSRPVLCLLFYRWRNETQKCKVVFSWSNSYYWWWVENHISFSFHQIWCSFYFLSVDYVISLSLKSVGVIQDIACVVTNNLGSQESVIFLVILCTKWKFGSALYSK